MHVHTHACTHIHTHTHRERWQAHRDCGTGRLHSLVTLRARSLWHHHKGSPGRPQNRVSAVGLLPWSAIDQTALSNSICNRPNKTMSNSICNGQDKPLGDSICNGQDKALGDSNCNGPDGVPEINIREQVCFLNIYFVFQTWLPFSRQHRSASLWEWRQSQHDNGYVKWHKLKEALKSVMYKL